MRIGLAHGASKRKAANGFSNSLPNCPDKSLFLLVGQTPAGIRQPSQSDMTSAAAASTASAALRLLSSSSSMRGRVTNHVFNFGKKPANAFVDEAHTLLPVEASMSANNLLAELCGWVRP